MRTPYSSFTSLIVIVAALALVGGIAIVLVTSRDSLELAPDIWFGDQTPPAAATQPASATPTEPPPEPTATATMPPEPTATEPPTATPEPTLTPTPEAGLASGVTAIAEVALEGAAARLRDAPNGRVIGALMRGTRVEILQGREVAEGITWLEVRAETGETGWMAEGLLQIISAPASQPAAPTATATPQASPTATVQASPSALPTLTGGARGTAVVALDSGVAARLRDAPAGRVIGGLPDGTPLTVLQGRETREGVVWIEVQDNTGQTGWISETLVQYTSTSS